VVKIEKDDIMNYKLNDIFELLLLNDKIIKDLQRDNTKLKIDNDILKAKLSIWNDLEIIPKDDLKG
jgi:hypothetical protein